MTFYPDNRFPKEGQPVYNGNGEQYDISDPRYAYQDGRDNTNKPPGTSTDNLYSTPEAALARAVQIGCNGYHVQGVPYPAGGTAYFYAPCGDGFIDLTGEEWLARRKEQIDSALNFTYIGSYRVLSWDKPYKNVSSLNGWIIDSINTSTDPVDLNAQDISIDFRYSVDGESWSLWTNVGTAITGISQSTTSNDRANPFIIALDPSLPFYPEFRFTSTYVNNDGTIGYTGDSAISPSIIIIDFDLDVTYTGTEGPNNPTVDPTNSIIKAPVPTCSEERSNRPVVFNNDCTQITFNPYAVNSALNLYQDLSLSVNKLFGWEVNYYSVQAQSRSKDVILKEFTLYDVVDEKCVKVMVPQNQFPDNKINFDPFGLQFEEPFEIHIDKIYFESFFGRGSQPRKRDIIYFPLTNRIYEINSMYLFRDFMYSPVYFKIELKKYQPKSNTYYADPAYKEELDGISLNSQTLFGPETTAEEEKLTKPQQYVTSTQERSVDPTRSYLYKDLPIVSYDLNNNWTIVFNQYYDMDDSFRYNEEFIYDPSEYRQAVRYKNLPILTSAGELAYTAWFNIRNYYDQAKMTKRAYPTLPITVISSDDQRIVYSTHPYRHNLQVWRGYSENPEGYVSILADPNHTGGFRVKSVINEYQFSVANPNIPMEENRSAWRMQKAQARNLLDGLYVDSNDTIKGLRIDLIHSGLNEPSNTSYLQTGSVEVVMNDLVINSPLQFTPVFGDWYAIVVNISNKYKQVAINIWEMSYDPTNPQEQSSNLNNVHEYVRSLSTTYTFAAEPDLNTDLNSPYYGTDNNSYKIITSPLYISNIRLFKQMIDIDKQSIVLNQNIVRDAQLAHIIDNAQPLLKLPKFANRK
jgi:hypothetical protein